MVRLSTTSTSGSSYKPHSWDMRMPQARTCLEFYRYISAAGGTPVESHTILRLGGDDSLGEASVDIINHDESTEGLKLAGTLVTASAAEINKVDGIPAAHRILHTHATERSIQIGDDTSYWTWIAASTATYCRYASTLYGGTSTDWGTVTNSTVYGLYVEILTAGLYHVQLYFRTSSADDGGHACVQNAAALGTNSGPWEMTINMCHTAVHNGNTLSDELYECNGMRYLAVGEFIKVATEGVTTMNSSHRTGLRITQVWAG